MKRLAPFLICMSLLLCQNVLAGSLTVDHAYVRATPPHTQNSAAFMVINNNSKQALKLTSVSSDIAARVELHNHVMEDGLMKMRQVEQIAIKAGDKRALQPGSYHIMFIGLKKPLLDGESVQLQLHFDNGEAITINAPIKKIKMHNNKTH